MPGGERPRLNDDTAPLGALVADRSGGTVLQPADPRSRPAGSGARSWRTRSAWAFGFTLTAAIIFACCLRQSQTVAVTSDDSSNALQAWDMLHGNLLLHHWVLSDVPFYTTELPKFMLAEAIFGLGANVVHLVAAATYTLLVLLAALLAKGRATGRADLARMLLAGGIMLTPQLGSNGGTYTLILSPNHLGTGIPLLLTWLLLDRARPRWYVPVAAWALLTLALFGDPLAAVIGVAPLILACAVRLGRILRGGQRLRSGWYEASLAGAAIASVAGASLATYLVKANGGWTTWPVKTALAGNGALLHSFQLTGEGLLELFGANVFAQPPDHNAVFTLFAVIHLAGAALAAWACGRALRRFFRWEDLIIQVLVLAIILNVTAYAFGAYANNIRSTREIPVVLPYAAVLAGRLLAGRPAMARLAPVLAVLGVCYALIVGVYLTQPARPPANASLAAWLSAHHLTGGLSGFWQANSVTLDSHGTVHMRPVGPGLAPMTWEDKLSVVDPRSNYANFVVCVPHSPEAVQAAKARARFGPPARVYTFRQYTIMVWNRNLLSMLPSPQAIQK